MPEYCSICDKKQELAGLPQAERQTCRAVYFYRCVLVKCPGPRKDMRGKKTGWPVCVSCSQKECYWCDDGSGKRITLLEDDSSDSDYDTCIVWDPRGWPPRFSPWSNWTITSWQSGSGAKSWKHPPLTDHGCTSCQIKNRSRFFVGMIHIQKGVTNRYVTKICWRCLQCLLRRQSATLAATGIAAHFGSYQFVLLDADQLKQKTPISSGATQSARLVFPAFTTSGEMQTRPAGFMLSQMD